MIVPRVALYRSSLSLASGAGQLLRMQAEALRAAGDAVQILGRTGRWKYRLRTGLPVRHGSAAALKRLAASGATIVDHGMELVDADVVFVHNLMAEAVRYLPRQDWAERADQERAFLRSRDASQLLVANSELVRQALIDRLDVPAESIAVIHPGIDSGRFMAGDRVAAKRTARRALRLDASVPLVGFVTSGDLAKRGIDIFLAAAERIAAARADARFLVVGGRRLPREVLGHPLVAGNRLWHRPKSLAPETGFAALDVFLYPARFEEFGMVVSEAQAAGLPILTSKRVGAVECLPAAYAPWLLDAPEAEAFAELALKLLDDRAACAALAAAGAANVPRLDRARYVDASVRTIRARRR